jgi:hypothetical protein
MGYCVGWAHWRRGLTEVEDAEVIHSTESLTGREGTAGDTGFCACCGYAHELVLGRCGDRGGKFARHGNRLSDEGQVGRIVFRD